jgi:hypothetical protein
LVGERTRQLEEEQKKTDELLHRMLPPYEWIFLLCIYNVEFFLIDCMLVFLRMRTSKRIVMVVIGGI